MLRRTYITFKELAKDISDTYNYLYKVDDSNDVSIIAKYAEAEQVMIELVKLGYGLSCITISEPYFNEYEDEFIITLYDGKLWCNPFKQDGNEYKEDYSTETFLLDNCSSAVLNYINGAACEVSVGDEDDAPAPVSSYKVNGKYVDRDTYDEAIRKYEDFIKTLKFW